MLISKEIVRQTFSRYAKDYDYFCEFQRTIGSILFRKILEDRYIPTKILDIGMGTGIWTSKLFNRFGSMIVGCDFAWGMVDISNRKGRALYIVQADAENLCFKDNFFNLVFSNLVYQWIPDLKQGLSEVMRIMSDRGRFYLSVMCEGSLKELYSLLGGLNVVLPTYKYITDTMKSVGFKGLWSDVLAFRRSYRDVWEFLRGLKFIGAGRISKSPLFGFGNKEAFLRFLNEYQRRFNSSDGIYATYKVIFFCVEK